MNVCVEREHRGRIIGRRIGVRKTAAKCAAIANLWIADRGGGLDQHRTILLQHRGRRDGVMNSAGPDLQLPAFRRIPDSSGMRAMSISVPGWLRRSFMTGIRLCPPAINFPSPFAARNFVSASSTDAARVYSNAVGITIGLPG